MPTPQSLEQCFTLFGCIMAVYVAARLIIKVLYRTIVWAIAKIEGKENDRETDDREEHDHEE